MTTIICVDLHRSTVGKDQLHIPLSTCASRICTNVVQQFMAQFWMPYIFVVLGTIQWEFNYICSSLWYGFFPKSQRSTIFPHLLNQLLKITFTSDTSPDHRFSWIGSLWHSINGAQPRNLQHPLTSHRHNPPPWIHLQHGHHLHTPPPYPPPHINPPLPLPTPVIPVPIIPPTLLFSFFFLRFYFPQNPPPPPLPYIGIIPPHLWFSCHHLTWCPPHHRRCYRRCGRGRHCHGSYPSVQQQQWRHTHPPPCTLYPPSSPVFFFLLIWYSKIIYFYYIMCSSSSAQFSMIASQWWWDGPVGLNRASTYIRGLVSSGRGRCLVTANDRLSKE